jgi:hypothetical protein
LEAPKSTVNEYSTTYFRSAFSSRMLMFMFRRMTADLVIPNHLINTVYERVYLLNAVLCIMYLRTLRKMYLKICLEGGGAKLQSNKSKLMHGSKRGGSFSLQLCLVQSRLGLDTHLMKVVYPVQLLRICRISGEEGRHGFFFFLITRWYLP